MFRRMEGGLTGKKEKDGDVPHLTMRVPPGHRVGTGRFPRDRWTNGCLHRSHTLVWNVQNMCVRNGCSQAKERTLFSTIVHSTSSSIKTTSFFRALIAKN